jgi:hypothetical protein
MFNNAGTVVNWVDESFGSGCPTMTTYQPRPWNTAGGTHKTGRMFFSDMEGNFLSEFHVGDLRPQADPNSYCSAHMGMAVMGVNRDLLVNAWYTGGVDVIDFSDPVNLKEIGQLVRVPVHGPDVQGRGHSRLCLRRRRGAVHREGHSGVQRALAEARQLQAGGSPEPPDDGGVGAADVASSW